MKILFLTRKYYPSVGGVEKHIAGLASELRKKHDITIITEKYDPRLEPEEKILGAKIYRIPTSDESEKSKKWTIWDWLHRHNDLLKSADIIHVHDIVYALYLEKLFNPGLKFFTTFHGWEGIFPIPIKNVLKHRLDARLSQDYICVGEYISKWYGIKSHHLTYGACNPVPLSKSPSSPRKQLLYLGRLAPDTGFTECLDRYRRLKSKFDWDLTVVGDGPLRTLVPPEAKFSGFVSDPRKYIQSADYVFTPGYLGILESFAQHKVVLCSYDNPLKKDYFMCHPMSKYLVFGDDLPDNLPAQPYNWARQQTWAKLADQYLHLWGQK